MVTRRTTKAANSSKKQKAVGRSKAKTKKAGSKKRNDPKELISFYRDMLLIRRFEERAGQLYGMG